jgi:hypothetical protein
MSLSPELVDHGGMALALLVPAIIVLGFARWQVTGPLGVFSFWAITVEQGHLLAQLDPTRDAAMLDSIWFFIGWIPGVAYCWLLYGIRRCFLWVGRRRNRSAASDGRNA